MTTGEATNSICSTGWRLPSASGSNNKTFAYLINAYGFENNATNSTKLTQVPFNITTWGYYNGNDGNLGEFTVGNGYLTSSTSLSATQTAHFHHRASSFDVAYSYEKRAGLPVRCISK